MKYLSEILWLLSWPVLIYVTYLLSMWAIRRTERKQPSDNA